MTVGFCDVKLSSKFVNLPNVKNQQTEIFRNGRAFSAESSFLFVIDFLMENVLIFRQEDLDAQKILVDFPNFKNVQPFTFETKEVTWKSFPQSKEDYQKALKSCKII